MMKKLIQYSLFGLIGAGFIYLAFRNSDFPALIEKIKSADFFWIGLAWLAGMISNFSRAMRWTILVEPLGYKVSRSNSFHGVMISYLVNFVIPRGGELVRAATLSRSEKMPLPTVVGSVVAERVMDVLCMGLVFLLALGLQYDIIISFLNGSATEETAGISSGEKSFPWLWLIAGLGMLGAVTFLLLRKKKPEHPLMLKINGLYAGFLEGIKAIGKLKKPLGFIVHSIVIWVMYFLMVFVCFYAIPETSHLGTAAGLTVLVMSTIAVVLPAPGGLGTFHFFVSKALILYGIKEADGLVYATIAHASQMIMFIFFGSISLIWMIVQQRREIKK
jgi:uncharacterized membrane protein YbhN (UPF0104 family)